MQSIPVLELSLLFYKWKLESSRVEFQPLTYPLGNGSFLTILLHVGHSYCSSFAFPFGQTVPLSNVSSQAQAPDLRRPAPPVPSSPVPQQCQTLGCNLAVLPIRAGYVHNYLLVPANLLLRSPRRSGLGAEGPGTAAPRRSLTG